MPSKRLYMLQAATMLIAITYGTSCGGSGGGGSSSGGDLSAPGTYYVSPAGSDGSSGNAAAPFKTIQKAANVANPGDTIIVRDGVYTDTDGDNYIVNVQRGGARDKWITFRSENRWGAKLDGKGNATGYCWNFTSGANYVRVEDFDISGCRYGGVWSNMKAHDVYIYGNNIHDIGRMCVYVAPGVVAIGQSGAFQGSGTAYHTYDSNIIHDIGRLDCGYPGTDFNHDHGLYLKGHHNTIINNVFYNNRAGWGLAIVGGGATGDSVGWLVSNNTFSGSNPGRSGHILISWSGPAYIAPSDVVIQNNLSSGEENYLVNIRDKMSGTLRNVVIRNNLTSTADMIEWGDWGEVVLQDNIMNTIPKLRDPSNYDFHLLEDSPAVDRGIADRAPSRDCDRNERPRGKGFDIGAYER